MHNHCHTKIHHTQSVVCIHTNLCFADDNAYKLYEINMYVTVWGSVQLLTQSISLKYCAVASTSKQISKEKRLEDDAMKMKKEKKNEFKKQNSVKIIMIVLIFHLKLYFPTQFFVDNRD